ncbi:MAG: PEPxxWA-CTERM sorting domain-containing protein [Proteobacteria bacterium]|nr:PEPxxWA-CTERM sorting domain-containing protein [Pseudomonadota bacterium]
MFKFLASAMALAMTAYASPSTAATVLLDFKDATCTTIGLACAISQTYGDGTGVDVSYHTLQASNGQATSGLNLWQTGGYGDLADIVYAGSDMTHYEGQIVLTALAGYQLSLLDFDYASYHGAREASPFTITDLAGHPIASFTGLGSTTHGHAVVDSALGDGVILTWGPDAYNFGVGDVRFDVEAIAGGVPEPMTWALMIVGFGGVGVLLRHRRAPAFA